MNAKHVKAGDHEWKWDEQNGWVNDEDDPAWMTETALLDRITHLEAMLAVERKLSDQLSDALAAEFRNRHLDPYVVAMALAAHRMSRTGAA